MTDEMDAMEFGPDILTLSDEDGTEYTFEVIDAVDIGEDHYLALMPVGEDEDGRETTDDGEFVILKTEYEGEDEILVPIEDQEELSTVFETFMNRLEEFYELHEESGAEPEE